MSERQDLISKLKYKLYKFLYYFFGEKFFEKKRHD